MLEALLHAILHGAPEFHQAAADFFFAAPGFFIRQHQFGNAQVVGLAQLQQLHGTGKIIGQLGTVHVRHTALGLGFIHHETATHRVIGVAVQLAVFAKHHQGHGVGMERQVFVEQAHVPRPHKGHRQTPVQQQRVGFAQGVNAGADLRGVDCVWPFAHQAHDGGGVAAVADAGGRQRAVQLHFDTLHLFQPPTLTQPLNEQCRGAHGPHGVRTRRPDADLEQVENADSH